MAIGIEEFVVISAADWPPQADVPPGDLTRFAPIGLGMEVAPVMRPWDALSAAVTMPSFYGASARTGDPFHDAPTNDAAGGLVYFDSSANAAALDGMLAFLEVRESANFYAVYAAEATDPPRDRYLAQIRMIDFGAMNLFGAIPPPDGKPWQQPLTIGQLIRAFIAVQRERWGSGMSRELRGTLAGDGDVAKEKLAFGFMVENGSNGVYRLWSRPWLVTK